MEGYATPKGAMFCIVGCGTVEKICKTAHKTSELIFKNVLHAPELVSNLILINCFDKARFNVIFGGGQVQFQDQTVIRSPYKFLTQLLLSRVNIISEVVI